MKENWYDRWGYMVTVLFITAVLCGLSVAGWALQVKIACWISGVCQ